MTEQLYRIHWRANKTGETGHGTATFTEELAKDICAKLNLKYWGLLHHWHEPVPPDEKESEASDDEMTEYMDSYFHRYISVAHTYQTGHWDGWNISIHKRNVTRD